MWSGPYDGYLSLTPFDTETNKNAIKKYKTLEEAKECALRFKGFVGGITKIGENKFVLRKGTSVMLSPKQEISWIYMEKQDTYKEKYADIKDEEWSVIKNCKKTKKQKDWEEWKYENCVYEVNTKTCDVRDIQTKKKIGTRWTIKPSKKDYGTPDEVLIWCVVPY